MPDNGRSRDAPAVDKPGAAAPSLRQALLISIGFVAVLWAIKTVELIGGTEFSAYGVLPRRASGLAGIILAPLLHSSVRHVLANSGPLVLLGTTLIYGYPRSAPLVIPLVWLGSGAGVWLCGRAASHIGASGVTFGMLFFVFTVGVLRWHRRAIALSMIVFFFYGGMIWGIFPGDPDISYEAHFFGAATGVILAFVLRHRDPAPPARRYS